MQWDVISTIATVVSATAVVTSVCYAAYQIRQSSIASRASTHQQWTFGQNIANGALIDNPEVCDLIVQGNSSYESLTEAERIRLSFVFWNYFNLWSLARHAYSKNLLDRAMCAESIQGYEIYAQMNPVMRRIWEICGPAFGTEFRAYVESIIASANEVERVSI